MTPVLALTVPTPDFPVVGDNAPIAVMFLAHMAVAQYSLGAITLAAPMELWSLRRGGDERGLRYARSLANSYYLVFSLGATLAVFAITLLVGLWGQVIGTLVNQFFLVVGLAMCLFVVLAPLLVWYRNSWERMDPGRHCLLGFAVLFWQTLFLVLIVVIDADMMTPGSHDLGGLAGLRGIPSYWPLLAHRLIGNVSWTALFLAAFAGLRLLRSEEPRERAFQSWAAVVNLRIGLATAVLMPVAGFAIIEVVKSAQPGYFSTLLRGNTAWLMVIQAVLLGVVLVGGNVALALEEASWRDAPGVGRACLAVTLGGMAAGCMPSAVVDGGLLWVRYAGIGAAIAATAVHLLTRTVGHSAPRLAMAPGALRALPFTVTAAARRALLVAGVTAVALSLFMGYIKDAARGPDAIQGELTQSDGHQRFDPQGVFP